jgi:hypothetical protein
MRNKLDNNNDLGFVAPSETIKVKHFLGNYSRDEAYNL